MSDKPWGNICNRVDTCALTGAGAFCAGIPGSEILVNGPLWCYFYALRYLEHADYHMADRFHGSQPDNSAIVYGSESYLTDTLNRILQQDKYPELLFVESSCSLSLIGDDLNGIVNKLQLPFPHVAMDSGGIVGGFAAGYIKACRTILEKFAAEAETEANTVNLLGLSDFYYNGKADTAELVRILRKAGYIVNCVPGSGSNLAALRNIGAAELNIVCHEELGLEIAAYLKERFGTAYISAGLPYGIGGTRKWLQKINEALPAKAMQEILAECDEQSAFLQSWNNDSRCSWGSLWFDRAVVAMPGTAALGLGNALVSEWCDTGHLTVICQNRVEQKHLCQFADDIFFADSDGDKISACLKEKGSLLLLGSSSESSIVRHSGNKELISLNMAFPATEQILLTDSPYMGIKGSAHMLERIWNAFIQQSLRR